MKSEFEKTCKKCNGTGHFFNKKGEIEYYTLKNCSGCYGYGIAKEYQLNNKCRLFYIFKKCKKFILEK